MTKPCPWSDVAHQVPPRRGDSVRGIRWAAEHHKPWADVNVGISSDGVAVAAHGSPYGLAQQGFLPRGDFRQVRDLTDEELSRLVSPDGYHIPTMREIFHTAAHHGRKVEPEAKHDHRFTFQRTWWDLARDARSAWGEDWPEHTCMKILTDLEAGDRGLEFALAVMEAAHQEGWRTMVLPRGRHRLRVIAGPSITYNRGGRCRRVLRRS